MSSSSFFPSDNKELNEKVLAFLRDDLSPLGNMYENMERLEVFSKPACDDGEEHEVSESESDYDTDEGGSDFGDDEENPTAKLQNLEAFLDALKDRPDVPQALFNRPYQRIRVWLRKLLHVHLPCRKKKYHLTDELLTKIEEALKILPARDPEKGVQAQEDPETGISENEEQQPVVNTQGTTPIGKGAGLNFGHNGIRPGTWWPKFRDVYDAGGHGHTVIGIMGHNAEGAYSVLSSNPQKACKVKDIDRGKKLLYGDHRDQGNLALNQYANQGAGNKVRVFRGKYGKKYPGPEYGFRYDGLYEVKGVTTESVLNYSYQQYELVRAEDVTENLGMSLEDCVAEGNEQMAKHSKEKEEQETAPKAKKTKKNPTTKRSKSVKKGNEAEMED